MKAKADETIFGPAVRGHVRPANSHHEFSHREIALIPPPTNDPRDPLNWTVRRKYTILAVLCLASFSGAIAPLSGQLNLGQQSVLYHKTILQESYANSAALAGIAAGPFFFAPIAHVLGRSSVIFWCLVVTLVCQSWAAVMTSPDDYIPFIMSRLFSGFFGAVPTVLGPRILTDMFFLHQRGRAFTALHMAFLFGTIAGPTFSAFISAQSRFPVEFWWTVGLLGGVLVLVFLFLEETGFDRERDGSIVDIPQTFVKKRMAMFFFGQSVVRRPSLSKTARVAVIPLITGICPVTLIMGTFTLISFGFYVAMNALVPVWLQKPTEEGGYSFTLEQNAAFTFSHWIGIVLVQIYGHYANDRIPLMLTRRWGKGVWKPEYRLHSLWIPSLILNPIGLGIFGATLQYRLHYMVLALAVFIVTIGSLASVPVTVNYLVECFTHYPAETGIVIGAFRIAYGLTVSFYINEWVAAVGVGWVYGMMAFFAVISFMLVMVVMWKGHEIRELQFKSVSCSEEGQNVLELEKRNTAES